MFLPVEKPVGLTDAEVLCIKKPRFLGGVFVCGFFRIGNFSDEKFLLL